MKILREAIIECDREIKVRKPGIVVVNKNERSCAITYIAIPGDMTVSEKEKKENERYQKLKRETKRIWNIRSINAVSVVVGALGSTSKKLKNCIKELGVVISTALLQKAVLRGTTGIIRKVLDVGKCCGNGGGERGNKKLEKGKGRGRVPKTKQVTKNVKV